MPNYIYALHDIKGDAKQRQGAIAICSSLAEKYNSENYGIFRTVQKFKSNIRKSDNLEAIVSFAIDLDNGTKELQLKRIFEIDIEPTKIIEVKRGFHVYFDIEESEVDFDYTKFMTQYLVPLYNADNGAKDLCRILRVPNFYHCKDPDNKFLVTKTYSSNVIYKKESFMDIAKKRFKELTNKYMLVDPYEIKKIEKSFISEKRNNTYSAEQIAHMIGSPIKCGNGWKVKCIAHQEKEPSLFISEGETVPVIFHCFGGCDWKKVFIALQERGLW
jgi:hypothetical protein